ncbi:myoferlin [Nematostella vectensis]|uniref:myoferlin n=1 Tax=Nematostella vectensis TaxID=45351 RepID=UPI0020774611|nr:myoferlin [Nematostella vectensis]
MLKVFVKSATNLPDVDRLGGKSDPYAVVCFQGLEEKTDVVKDELNPSWNKELTFNLNGRSLSAKDEVTVQVKDWEKVLFHRLLGSVTIPLGGLTKGKLKNLDKDLELLDVSKRPISSKIQLSLRYESPPDPTGSDVIEEEEFENGDEDEERTSGASPGAEGKPRKKRQKKKKNKELSDKVQDFQIRVRVFEARQLPGGNIHPAVRVCVSKQAQQTQAKKSTHRPTFNQTFTFKLRGAPADLFNDCVCFEVYDVRKFRRDALLGFFEMEIGDIYERQDHSIIRKWMLLSVDDKHAHDDHEGEDGPRTPTGDPAGYLKATVSVLGPKDPPPNIKKLAEKDTSDDIESNLLRPSGVTLQPVVLTLKVYLAEDLPQMDSSAGQGIKKFFGFHKTGDKFVDPYAVVSFSGKKIQTAIKYKTDCPAFNQTLRIPAQFPSMCDHLKIQLFDWDRLTDDDCIGTAVLLLSDISGRGEQGFLPQFGPCFVNFYGSPREFSELPDEFDQLNYGKGEGVAYRGRLMVELETSVTEEIDDEIEDIDPNDVIRLQPFLSRTKYKLFACFYEASMVAEVDGPVEFEVSIGNYGNAMDESVAPSNTPPCNAVYDGSYYYYLPWGEDKPCVCVESYWEDITFRLEPLNVICGVAERLENGIRDVRSIQAQSLAGDAATVLLGLLDQLIKDCSKPLPNLKGRSNKLDAKLRQQRIAELAYVTEEARALSTQSPWDLEKTLFQVEELLQVLKDLTVEPQNCVPDIIIWMLSGSNRVAYHRIPVNEVLYSVSPDARGKSCKKTVELIMKYPDKKSLDFKSHPEVPAVVRLELWFGREEFQGDWTDRQAVEDGAFCVFAETYENEMNVASFWTKKLLPRPDFSNPSGDFPLPKEKFQAPAGWKFEGDWFINPELSLTYERDAGHTSFLEDLFENESRMLPGGNWKQASQPWTDVCGDASSSPKETPCPEGWAWSSTWQVDRNRAVDDDGWEYSVDVSYGAYGPIQKAYHLVRRRRLVRQRNLMDSHAGSKREELEEFTKEGWVYSMTFSAKFHAKKRNTDFVRRRRWHKKMIPQEGGEGTVDLPPVLQVDMDGKSDEKGCIRNLPRMFVSFKSPRKFQLWVYLYQARDLVSLDDSGMNDCYARVAFGKQSQSTEIIPQSLCPCWDQTLVFEHVNISESLDNISRYPPNVFIELFDKDSVGKDDFLGRGSLVPIVRLNGYQTPEPELKWIAIKRGQETGGEVLAACELFLDEGADLPFSPIKRGDGIYGVRSGVRPKTQRAAIEVLCWGVRNMAKFELTSVTSPSVEVECGGAVVTSDVIRDTRKTPNFSKPTLPRMILNLPVKEVYSPPINIRVRDNRSFGRCPIVGVHSIKTLTPFKCQTPVELEQAIPANKVSSRTSSAASRTASHTVDVAETRRDKEKKTMEQYVDWWSKFYASIGQAEKAGAYLDLGYQTITVYQTELERVEEFGGFKDFILTFPIRRGKSKSKYDQEDAVVGEFKGAFRVYPLPPDERNMTLPETIYTALPPSEPTDCLVRVYVVKGVDLQPQDTNGKVDSYLIVSLGKKKFDDETNYVANNLNPEFGRMFEFSAQIPLVKDLKVVVKDRDVLGRDDVIGETVIDLEQRLLSRFRATCGLSKEYCRSGVNKWRDSQKPMNILKEWCAATGKQVAIYGGNTLILDGQTYSLDDIAEEETAPHGHHGSTDQRLALHALNQLRLVPEHVETRPLYNPLQPHFEQGKIQMWVDIFPKHLGTPPPPVKISARKPKNYVARVIVWNTADVQLQETSITGEKMSDIYIKGWLDGIDDSQETDVHYRCMDGEGNFNWRFVFPFMYLPHDKKMVVIEKDHILSMDATTHKIKPKLVIQVWDNDILGGDDYIGSGEFELTKMPQPAKTPSKCRMGGEPGSIDLFQQRSAYGWWPLYSIQDNKEKLAGKVEMTIEILNEEEAELRPAGQGRDDPNRNPTLDEPQRPSTSFLWFASPLKTLRYVIWRNYKWTILTILVVLLIIIFLVLLIYSTPGYTVKKILGA